MIRLLLLKGLILLTVLAQANTIVVKNINELKAANKEAKPGDVMVLQDGEWNNVNITLTCSGTKDQPITFKAQTQGKVSITGHSQLKLGGNYITVDGLYFTNGYAGRDAVINFRIDSNHLANNCRVTNCVVNDFNNPKRLDENYWVSFSGKNNRLDHCSFFNKKNLGVLLAVILDDDRSRENFHSIDHNYFGFRLPLASNGGEMIRIGVSQHCEFNSNTQVVDNFFEHCDGETEIISVKSCSNVVRNNLFKECQGGVVLRHGHFNTVMNNIFLGNNKAGTGGVRIINNGQWVVNNLFYKCRGTGFRSPLSIMNGVPNSPAFRYVAVTNAVIANNSFFECTPASLCEGSDAERSVTPQNVQFINNIFYTNSDSLVYRAYDDISGISFSGNMISTAFKQQPVKGFVKTSLTTQQVDVVALPVTDRKAKLLDDSIQSRSRARLSMNLSPIPGFSDSKKFLQIEANAYKECGAKWFAGGNAIQNKQTMKADCATAEDIVQFLAKNNNARLTINLTGKEYVFDKPLQITSNVLLTSSLKSAIRFSMALPDATFIIRVKAGNALSIENLSLDLSASNAQVFITTDTSGSSNHSNFRIANCRIANMNGTLLNAAKSSVADSIIITNCMFTHNKGTLFGFTAETDQKGYYNVERLKITNCEIDNHTGQVLAMLRSGNDESTMGPFLTFANNEISNCRTGNEEALIHLYGTQRSLLENNHFQNCNPGKVLIKYEDVVKADHFIRNNKINASGRIVKDKFVDQD